MTKCVSHPYRPIVRDALITLPGHVCVFLSTCEQPHLDSTYTGWGQSGAHMRQGDENVVPYGSLAH